MSRWFGWLSFAALVVVVAGWVPIGGKTAFERLRSLRAPAAAVQSAWRSAHDGWDRLWGDDPAPERAAAAARPPKAFARPARTERPDRPDRTPQEHHTDSDRTALDRIVAEHAR
jgi:hypothetical protein